MLDHQQGIGPIAGDSQRREDRHMPLAPGAGVATTPHDSNSTSFTGQRNRSDSRQLTICGT